MITIKRLEKLTGISALKWHGNCVFIANTLADDLGAESVYGHWLGGATDTSYWAARAHHPFIQHGWVVLPDGSILDPTRFSFEGVAPYIWQGANDGNYDRGGNKWRETRMQYKSFPDANDDRGWLIDDLPPFKVSIVVLGHMMEICSYGGSFPKNNGYPHLHPGQVFWFANCPINWLEPYARDIYAAIDGVGLRAFIPCDNARQAGV